MSTGPGGRGDDRGNPGAPRVGYDKHDNDDGGRHHTLHDDKQDPGHENHISWDSDRNGDYQRGGEDRDGRRINTWPDRGGGRGG